MNWRVEKDRTGRYIMDGGFCVADVGVCDGDDQIANLIAAAPDLLSALQECVDRMAISSDESTRESLALEEARAAIKKALGQ